VCVLLQNIFKERYIYSICAILRREDNLRDFVVVVLVPNAYSTAESLTNIFGTHAKRHQKIYIELHFYTLSIYRFI
jgi:hypothetical protein